jgi:hypothetical protein
VNEDYDDSGEDEKKGGIVTNGSGSTSGDLKTAAAGSGPVNGTAGPVPKVE